MLLLLCTCEASVIRKNVAECVSENPANSASSSASELNIDSSGIV